MDRTRLHWGLDGSYDFIGGMLDQRSHAVG